MKTKVWSRFVICSALFGLGCGVSGRTFAQGQPSAPGMEQKAEEQAKNEEKKVEKEEKKEEKKAENETKKEEKKSKKHLHHKGKKEKSGLKKMEKDLGM
ncbi:hypothetical protein MAMC_00956 [Methylacidimicrobium cyclopophantes]|uniref:Lipoprotein n=2 Tax=Methylacidimicrobium cyclopophantes TaxID=1041766 RepID=A0A5E6MKX6_9BACT|nr:hypothetical protein MAMC_00956 [Methylacidimicrobium cyclopophantes]